MQIDYPEDPEKGPRPPMGNRQIYGSFVAHVAK